MSKQQDDLASLKLTRASLEAVRLLTGCIVDDLKIAKGNYSDSARESARLAAALTQVKDQSAVHHSSGRNGPGGRGQ